jgi:predicted porin
MHRTPVFNEPAILGSRNRPRSLSEIIGGYRFNEIFAIQGGYIDFGEFGQDDVEASLKGTSLSLIGRLPLDERFGIYGKVAAFAHSTDVDRLGESESYDDVDPFVGVGADYRVTEAVSVFAEYNRYNVEVDGDDFNNQLDDDTPRFDTAQVGMRYRF